MRLIVCGGRKFHDRVRAFAALDAIHTKRPITLIISGGAPGADTLAEKWADANGVAKHIENAEWTKFGRAAGPMRNAKMLTLSPDGVLALPGGAGTSGMVSRAIDAGVEVWQPYG